MLTTSGQYCWRLGLNALHSCTACYISQFFLHVLQHMLTFPIYSHQSTPIHSSLRPFTTQLAKCSMLQVGILNLPYMLTLDCNHTNTNAHHQCDTQHHSLPSLHTPCRNCWSQQTVLGIARTTTHHHCTLYPTLGTVTIHSHYPSPN